MTESRIADVAVRRDRDLLDVLVHERTAELTAANEMLQREVARRADIESDLLNKQTYLEELLRLQEAERKLISFEIHDGAIQNVVGARMQLDAVIDAEIDPERRTKLTKTSQLLRAAIDESRRVIAELRPQLLDDLGLRAAIEDLIVQHARDGLAVDLTYELGDLRRTPFVETMIYRIVQESLTNVKKHAVTDRARVKMRREAEHAVIVVADAGCGFDKQAKVGNRMGLRGLRERAKAMGGELTIDSAPGRGTVVNVRIPFVDPAEAAAAERDQAAAALHLNRLRMQAILDETPACIFIKDHQGRYELINRRWEEVFHVTRAEVRGKNDFELFPAAIAQTLWETDQRVLRSAEPITLEEFVPSDGEMRNYISVKFPIPGEQGGPSSLCGIATDITRQKRDLPPAPLSNAEFQAFMNPSPILAWVKDADGRYVFGNGRFLEHRALTREQLIGRTDGELYGPERGAAYRGHDLDVLASGSPKQYRERVIAGDGKPAVLEKLKFRLWSADGAPLVGGVAYEVPDEANY